MSIVYIPQNFSSCSICHPDPCSCQHTRNCDSCAEPTTCVPDTGCPVILDTKCSVYNKFGQINNLPFMNMPNGSTLTAILERIDDILSETSPLFSPYESLCLKFPGFIINDLPSFISTVDDKFCSISTDLNNVNTFLTTEISNLTSAVDTINHPEITDNCGLGILTTDTIKQILLKLKDGFCLLNQNIFSDNSPSFLPIESSTVRWLLAGNKNHTPTAIVKKSATAGNTVQILSDGLFVPNTGSGLIQNLSFNTGTRDLAISSGNTVNIPTGNVNQTLSLNTSTKKLSITGGNTVDFAPIIPVFSQTSISPTSTNSIQLLASGTANTNITANAKISSDVGNIVSIHSDGLFAPTPVASPDEKVKASSAGTTGTLIEKVEGCVNGSITTVVSYNNIADKLTVCSGINTTTLLTEISSTPALLTALCNMVKGCLCFKFRILNTDVGSTTYSYTGCDGIVHTGLSLGAGSSVDVCGTVADSPDTNTYIFNLGYC